MEERELLNGIKKKQKRGEGKADNKNAVTALMSLRKSIDEKQLASYLAGLHYSVCQNFLLEYCLGATDDEISSLANALMADEDMLGKNPTLFLYPKGFAAVFSLTAKQKYAPALMIMNRILARAESKKGFTAGALTVFNKIFAKSTDYAGLTELHSQLKSGKLNSEKGDRERLDKFLEFAQVSTHEKAKTTKTEFDMLSNIEKTQKDIVAMLKQLTEDKGTREAQDSENNELRKKVDDLTERLRVSIQMSDVSKNQELVNLKSEISKAIRLDYADYEKSKDKNHSKDLFKVYKAMLARVFKQLRRLDIPLT